MKRHIRQIALLVILCLAITFVTGCWGYKDVDELFIVIGGYLDRDPITKEFILYAEVLKPKGGKGGEMEKEVVSGKGDTIFAAIRDALISGGGKLYWGHTQVWVIGRRLAESGIIASLDMISRGTEIRTDTNVLIYDGDNIKELIEAHSKNALQNSMAQHLSSMIEDYRLSGKFVATPIWKVLSELTSTGTSLTMPLLEIYMAGDSMQMDVKGIAVFHTDRMVGDIDRDYGLFLYGFKGDLDKEYILYLPEINDIPANALEVASTEYKTEIKEGANGLTAKVRCEITADLTSFISDKDYLEMDTIVFLEREYERYIREEFLKMVREVQSKYGVDIFGFGDQTRIQLPDYWQKVKGDWNAAFRGMEVEIEPHVHITMTGMAHEPFVPAGGE